LLVIEINLGVGVETFEDKLDVLMSEQGWSSWNRGVIFPTRVFDPLQLGFVVAIKRIGNEMVAQQIEMNVSGNLGRTPSCLLASGFRNLTKFPSRIQENGLLLCRRLRGGECGEKHGKEQMTENRKWPRHG
jgi:hypothetical protein